MLVWQPFLSSYVCVHNIKNRYFTYLFNYMRVCNCLFKRARMGLRSTFLIFHSIWITLAMQSRQYCQSQYPRFLCLRNSFLCANSVYAICLFPVKVIFDSMTRCSTLWGHFVTLSLCLKISVFTLVLMLFTFFLFFLFEFLT